MVLGRLHVLDVDRATVAGNGEPVESASRPHARPTSIPWWEALSFSHMDLMRGTARLDARGRLVLPAELRRRLGLHAGDEVRISEEADGALRVETRRAAAQSLIGLAGTAGASAVDELTAERQRETEIEERDARRFRSARCVRRRK